MAATTLSNLGMQYKWFSGEDGWNTGMDANLLKLDTLVQGSVKNYVLTSPPGSPSEGDRYIVGVGSTGAWSGQSAKLAIYINAGWSFYTAKEGWKVWDENSNREIGFNGTAWVLDLDGDRAYAASIAGGNASLGKGSPNVIIDGFKFYNNTIPGLVSYFVPYEDTGNASFTIESFSTVTLDSLVGSNCTVDALKFILNVNASGTATGISRLGFISGSSDVNCARWKTGDKHQYLFRVAMSDLLPDGSNNFVYRVGLGFPNQDTLVNADPFADAAAGSANGFAAYFYVDNSSSYFQFVSGYLTTTQTTTTSVTASLNTFYVFKIVISTTGVVTAYINGVLVATHSTGVCVNGAGLCEQLAIRNMDLTTTAKKGFYVDEIAYKYELGTARTGFAFD